MIDVHQKPKQCFPLTLCNTPDEHDFDHDDVDKDDDVAMMRDEVGTAGDQSDVAVWSDHWLVVIRVVLRNHMSRVSKQCHRPQKYCGVTRR